MTGAERLDYLVRLAMEAWEATSRRDLTAGFERNVNRAAILAAARGEFAAAVRERLAQGAQVIECQLADAKDAGRAEADRETCELLGMKPAPDASNQDLAALVGIGVSRAFTVRR